MKLKILKDIEDKVDKKSGVDMIVNQRCGELDWFSDGILENYNAMIRKEVINWIKEIEKAKNTETQELPNISFVYQEDCEAEELSGLIAWIKHFFNITEEDLK